MRARDRIASAALRIMRSAIEDVQGREVLMVGTIDHAGVVQSVEVLARGHHGAVPAPRRLCERGQIVIHNHPSGNLSPSDADLVVASDLAEDGIGSAIVDNAVENIHVVVEPVRAARVEPLDIDELAAMLDEGGAAAARLRGFSPRASQIEMLRLVARAMNESAVAVAEAGTGVGKSFAYLIPAVAWAERNEQRVVIATATINLQHQLLEKDFAVVRDALGATVRAVVVKGRGNYLCRKRLAEQCGEAQLFDSPDPALDALREWADATADGSRSDLPFFVPDALWGSVNSDPDTCSFSRCPNRDRCFVGRARAQAAAARVLIANHHLVFSDLAVRAVGVGWNGSAILPPFQHLIFDEAHNLEHAATTHFSRAFTASAARKHLGRLERSRRGHPLGLLHELSALGADQAALTAAVDAVEDAKRQVETLNAQALLFLGAAGSWRATAATIADLRERLGGVLSTTQQRLLRAAEATAKLLRGLDDAVSEEPAAGDAAAAVRRLEDLASVLEVFGAVEDHDDSVVWMERRGGEAPVARFVITPLDIRSQMVESVYRPFESVVCTSATLTVNTTFDYWASRIGFPIDEPDTLSGRFPSPFDYAGRVLVAVPQAAPDPDRAEYEAYLAQLLPAVIHAGRGGALVLFTSHRQLESVWERTHERIEADGYTVYRQGADDRSRLLERFRKDVASVLFATDSFWEGVDAPGETLRLVIVCRLPFRVPTEPVQLARAEAIEAAGGNSFASFSLPQAVTKLKQGFGRLMRRADDFGAVVIADPRIVRKPYGRVFFASLPETRRVIDHGEEVLDTLRAFFRQFEDRL